MGKDIYRIVRRSLSLSQTKPIPADISSLNIRKTFLDFFCQDHRHAFVRSSPVMPFCDPTLAFVNAGMNQFKNVFLGTDRPPAARAANSQKCIRVGGKHNDLSQVGADETHHTFFEMLGNWSFGDYFKKEACEMSWELLTKVYMLDPNRLYVSYFAGDAALNLESDLETRDIWRGIGVENSQILPFGVKENFWEMGMTGPCGPCTEIHYDLIPDRTDAGSLVNVDGSNLTELWNLVFMQYNRKVDGSLEKLKMHHVDTGMGFERLVSILQNKNSNYDTDLFQPLIQAIQKISKQREYRGSKDEIDVAYRILADHTRMVTISLADGFLPDTQAKVKGILRRAIEISENVFKTPKGLVEELTNHVAENLGPAYPELGKNLKKVQHIIKYEEEYLNESKARILSDWKKLIKENEKLKEFDIMQDPEMVRGYRHIKKFVLNPGLKEINNDTGNKLIDGCGVEIESVEKIASILGLKFDKSSLENHAASVKHKMKEESQLGLMKTSTLHSQIISEILKKGIKPTLDSFKYDYTVDDFGNYVFKPQSANIVAIIKDGKFVDSVKPLEIDDEIGLILDRTNLYSEAGGQESDSGRFIIEDRIIFSIRTVTNINDCIIHFGKFENCTESDSISVHNIGVVQIDPDKRSRIMRNHTGLHLLNAALPDVLTAWSQVYAKITADKISLTCSVYRENLDNKEVGEIEKIVRNVIKHNVSVRRRTVYRNELERLDSISLIPGEIFPKPEVNVIEVNSGYFLSREPCCGTHVLNTSEIKDFAIVTNKFLKQGRRLLEAVTGDEAVNIRESDSKLEEGFRAMKEYVFSQLVEIKTPLDQLEKLHKEVLSFEKKLIQSVQEFSDLKRKYILNQVSETKQFMKTFVRMDLTKAFSELAENRKELFIVHVHPNIPRFVDIDYHRLTTICKNKSTMLFVKEDECFTICAQVLKEHENKNFSVELWLDQVEKVLGGKRGGPITGKTVGFNYIPRVKWDEKKVQEAARLAQDFAKENLKT